MSPAPRCFALKPGETIELLQPASRCMPREPLRCWQYLAASSAPVPRWTLTQLCWDGSNGPELLDDGNSTGVYMNDGDWLVELEAGPNYDPYAGHYTDQEFQVQFEVAP